MVLIYIFACIVHLVAHFVCLPLVSSFCFCTRAVEPSPPPPPRILSISFPMNDEITDSCIVVKVNKRFLVSEMVGKELTQQARETHLQFEGHFDFQLDRVVLTARNGINGCLLLRRLAVLGDNMYDVYSLGDVWPQQRKEYEKRKTVTATDDSNSTPNHRVPSEVLKEMIRDICAQFEKL